MNYRNTEMKLDQLVSYLNEEKINLSPAFQRGHVWRPGTRRKLIANIVQGRPIPAIFLYKEAEGTRYSYNILDGKQRLESLILFIGSERADLRIGNWARYFFSPALRRGVHFWIPLPEGKRRFAQLPEDVVRDFREYAIPTVEINLTDDSHLDEIINLFVDINQQGMPVSRFDIVKAMGRNNALLSSVFDLLALKQERHQDVFYKAKGSDFTRVLKTLEIIANLADPKSQVDRMWERLLEIALFVRSEQHRKPVDILKSFIRARDSASGSSEQRSARLSAAETKSLRKVFGFLRRAYKSSRLATTPLATDQTHFYTMVTSLIATDLLDTIAEAKLVKKLAAFGKVVQDEGRVWPAAKLEKGFKRYMELSSDRTTDTPRRQERQDWFVELVRVS